MSVGETTIEEEKRRSTECVEAFLSFSQMSSIDEDRRMKSPALRDVASRKIGWAYRGGAVGEAPTRTGGTSAGAALAIAVDLFFT